MNSNPSLRPFLLFLSVLLRMAGLLTILLVLHQQLVTITSQLPASSSFRLAFLRLPADFILAGLHSLADLLGHVPNLPLYLLVLLVAFSLVVSLLDLSSPEQPQSTANKLLHTLAHLSSGLALWLWYRLADHSSQTILDLRGLLTVAKWPDLPTKREAFAQAYQAAFRNSLQGKMPGLGPEQVDQLLQGQLQLALGVHDDQYYLAHSLEEVKKGASAVGRLDGMHYKSQLLSQQLAEAHKVFMAKVKLQGAPELADKVFFSWDTLGKLAGVAAAVAVVGLVFYAFFGRGSGSGSGTDSKPTAERALSATRENSDDLQNFKIEVYTDLDNTGRELRAIGRSIVQVHGRVMEHEEKIEGVAQRVAGLSDNAIAVSQRVAEHHNNIAAVSERVRGLNNNVVGVAQRVAGLNNNMVEATERVDRLNDDFVELAGNMIGQRTEHNQLVYVVAGQEEEIATVVGNVAQHTTRLEEHSALLETHSALLEPQTLEAIRLAALAGDTLGGGVL